MSGNKEFDPVKLRAEIRARLEEVKAREPVKLSPPRDSDEVFEWIAIYDLEATTLGLPRHYPDIDHLIQGSRPAEICGRLVPAPGNSKCGGQILEIEERLTFVTKMDECVEVASKPTEAEREASIRRSIERMASGEAQKEIYEAMENAVPGVVFRTTEAKALKILDEWFGVGREDGSPYERRLAFLKSPGMFAWVWCKARRDSHSDSGLVSTPA